MLPNLDQLEEFIESEIDYSIIGPTDDRFPIRARQSRPSSLQFPFNTICLLERDKGSGNWRTCTGTLIAPQVVLTAKHCLTGVKRIRVTPGADFSASTPKKRKPARPASIIAGSRRIRMHPTLDYGVIILPKPFRKPNRFMRLQPRSDRRTATLLTIAGYPCDKRLGTMWGDTGRIQPSGVTATRLRYKIDTCPGHSGSPIWLLGNSGIRILLGVHTAGPSRCDNDPRPGNQCRRTGAPVTPVPGFNSGVRINCDVINNIVRWCREFRVRQPVIDWGTYRRRCSSS